ncbi:hypothetical protein, partial [Desulfovibrio sp. ZJ369]|uniref:hypothetical protein n=1 Tax=Desulfovibrio sp. ZJ369 TaxID=2709793 RepID=UPI0019811B7A
MQSPHEVPQFNGFLLTRFEHGFLFLVLLHGNLVGGAAVLLAEIEHFYFENALLTRKRQPPQRGVHSGENRVFRLNATFDFHK